MPEFHGVLLKFILLEFVLHFVGFPFGNLNSNNQDLIQYRLILSLNFITVDFFYTFIDVEGYQEVTRVFVTFHSKLGIDNIER